MNLLKRDWTRCRTNSGKDIFIRYEYCVCFIIDHSNIIRFRFGFISLKSTLTFNQISAPIWPLPSDKADQHFNRKEKMLITGLSIQENTVAQINDGSVIAVGAPTPAPTR